MALLKLDAGYFLCSLAMLAMASAQSTSLATTINADSTSTAQTSYTLTDTSIAAATGSPPPVISTRISLGPTGATSTPTYTHTAIATTVPAAHPSEILSVPAIAGIAAGGAFLLISLAILTTFICVKRHRKRATNWPEVSPEMLCRSPSQPRRPSSAATLVAPVPQAYIHSKGSMAHVQGGPLHYSKSTRSLKSVRSTILECVSEEAAKDFKFDFSAPPPLERCASAEMRAGIPQVNEDALRKLTADKSLPGSPENELPTTAVIDLYRYQAQWGDRPQSSIYSTMTGEGGTPPVRESRNYF